MRTKTLLCLAALTVAGVTASMAQSNVYSLNVVGYVNKSFLNQNFVLVCNPLNNTVGNDLNHIMPAPPDNTQIWTWNDAQQKFDAEISGVIPTYSAGGATWVPNDTMPLGRGFFVVGGASSGSFTNTFVGDVKQGISSTAVLGGQNFDCLASSVPVDGGLTNTVGPVPGGYIPTDNDQIWTWNAAQQKFNAEITGNIPTWSAGSSSWVPDEVVPVGDGFFLVRADSSSTTWTRNYSVPQTP